MNLAALGWRNLLRHKRRTLVTLAALVVGLAGLTVFQGYVAQTMVGFREATIREGVGHVQIAASSQYFREGEFNPFAFPLTGAENLASELKSQPRVTKVFPSTGFTAIASTGEKSTTLLVKGYPATEMTFEGAGRNQEAAFQLGRLVSGTNPAGRPGELVLGETAARILRVKAGQIVTLMAILPGGGLNGQDFVVTGIYRSPGKDKLFAFTDYATAMEFSQQSSPPLLHVMMETAEAAGTLKLPASGGLVAKPWWELTTYFVQVNSMFVGFLDVIRVILLLITLFILANTMNRIVFERLKEWGTLRAMGTKRPTLVGLIVVEGSLQGLIGGLLGIGVGFLLSAVFNLAGGIPFVNGDSTVMIPVRPDLSAALVTVLPVVLTAALAAFFPALKVLQLTPSECLRQL